MRYSMKQVQLHKNSGFAWFRADTLRVKGYLFDRSGNLYSGEELLRYFEGIESVTDLEERVRYANGLFSVICKPGDDLLVAVDPFRTFPLFYARAKKKWVVSDDPYSLAEKTGNVSVDPVALTEFLATGYVTGSETLMEKIRQVQAGEIIHFGDDGPEAKFCFTYRCQTVRGEPYEELRNELKEILDRVSKRFIVSLEGKTAVVPLSGGFGSRLVAAILKQAGYEKVICFSYGRKRSSETAVSEKVAAKLGFRWIFVEYTNHLIRQFPEHRDFSDYIKYSGKLTSMVHLHEYFAVQYMKDNELIPVDSVFVPGILSNFLAGGMLSRHGNLSLEEETRRIAERIYNLKYCFKIPSRKSRPLMIEQIEKRLLAKFNREADLAYSIQEDYDFKERYAKLIINVTSTYTFFGYTFRLPICDLELVDFFRRLPLHAKINKYLYDDILTNDIFAPFDINFEHGLQPDEKIIHRSKLKNRIKASFPGWIKRLFMVRKDDLFQREITRYLKNDMARKGKKIRIYANDYNSLIIQWYAGVVEEWRGGRSGKAKGERRK